VIGNRLLRTSLRVSLLASVVTVVQAGPQAVDCASCHEQGKKISASAHAQVGCLTCHPGHEQYPHKADVPKPACAKCHADVVRSEAKGVHGQERAKGNTAAPDCEVCHGDVHELRMTSSLAFRQAVPQTCGMCHDEIAKQYLESVHGKILERGDLKAPLCTDCHGEHAIQRPSSASSPVHPSHIRETCARCHGDVRLSRRYGLPSDLIVSYDASYHGLAAKAGSQSVANCASCHGYHNILPSSDPRSTINSKNLPKTCGKCHPGAGKRFSLGPVHWTNTAAPAPVLWVRDLYLFLIPFVVGLMVLHNGGNWLRKLWRLRIRGVPDPIQAVSDAEAGLESSTLPELRMYRFERIQHILLLLSFTVLVWTGFALKYPNQWWAVVLTRWETVFPVRATIHRIAAVIMMTVAVIHLVSLIVDRKLRRHWLELWPRVTDVREAVEGLAWNLGLLQRWPIRSAHSYVEKVEYWAVVWGTAIMALTGVMLWANDFMLRLLPKVWLDVATSVHFYEAVLATASIVVWHLYTVIFDPEVYPLDTAWLTGFSVRKRPRSVGEAPSKESMDPENYAH